MIQNTFRHCVLALSLGLFAAGAGAQEPYYGHGKPPPHGARPGAKPPQHKPPQHKPPHYRPPAHTHRPPHYAPPPQWHSREQWRRAHARYMHGRYFDDWHRNYYYRPGQWVWYQGRAWEPVRPLSAAEIGLSPLQTPGLWVDITARFPLN